MSFMWRDNMSIATDFKSYIIEILIDNDIGKGMAEYQRAKDILPYDLSTDEYERAIKIVAEYCRI